MLSIAVESVSIIWNVTPVASTMTVKAEFIDGQRCWDVSQSYQCLNFAILLKMTPLRAFSRGISNSCFQTVG